MKIKSLFAITLGLALVLTACSNDQGSGNQSQDQEAPAQENVETTETSSLAPEEGAEEKAPITSPLEEDKDPTSKEANLTPATLYFPSEDYIITGAIESPYIEKPIQINLEEEDPAVLIIQALKDPQAYEAESTGLENFTILSAKTEEGQATVDFSSQGLNGGSLEEDILLSSLVKSLLSLDSVHEVLILVDSQEAETLMGHISIDKPFTAGDFQ
ncbi:MAG: GerMN domain-containing protein [Tissierellia bacterium]|nr:GerMN domain-containing protein [Tissierellia bacterium]